MARNVYLKDKTFIMNCSCLRGRGCMRILTQTTSSFAFSWSSFMKSSLLVIEPPDFSLQPFSFQLFTQLVTPVTTRVEIGADHVAIACSIGGKLAFGLTIDGELAVSVENQLLDALIFGLFQCSAGRLVKTTPQTSLGAVPPENLAQDVGAN